MAKARRLVVLALIAASLAARGADLPGEAAAIVVQQAAQSYDAGRYKDAAQLYLRLAEEGHDGAEVRYDLGNCYFKLGDLGRAILEYRRALEATPSLAPAKKNLALARSLLPARVVPWQRSPVESAVAAIPEVTLQWLVLAFCLIGNLALAAMTFLVPGKVRRAAAGTIVGALLCAGLCGAALAFARTVLPSHRGAVVVSQASVFPVPEASGTPIATLPAGSEVILAAREGDRALVLWGEGRGWIPAPSVEVP